MNMTPEQITRARLATARARTVLKPGDRLSGVTRCGGGRSNFTMTGWDGEWITSATRNDIHARHISKVNGDPVDFDTAPALPPLLAHAIRDQPAPLAAITARYLQARLAQLARPLTFKEMATVLRASRKVYFRQLAAAPGGADDGDIPW